MRHTFPFSQAGISYNSQLYFRLSPELLEVPAGIRGGSEETIQDGAANAVMLMLARNSELEGAVSSVKQLEEKFNHRYHYPWVFLNEVPFTEEFKQ